MTKRKGLLKTHNFLGFLEALLKYPILLETCQQDQIFSRPLKMDPLSKNRLQICFRCADWLDSEFFDQDVEHIGRDERG